MTVSDETLNAARSHLAGRCIVLVGLMGAGKTSIGRRLATRLGIPFVDTDTEVEAAAGCTVAEIFARHGEAVFRDGERRVIARLLEMPAQVMATGGGAFMDPLTRAAARRHGVSVWLRAELDVLAHRCGRRGGRPLLDQGDPRAILAKLMDERHPVYAEADIVVDSSDGPHEAVVDLILGRLATLNPAPAAPSTAPAAATP